MKPSTSGRKKGSKPQGFWFRKGRGWFVTEAGRPVPLLDAGGVHLKDPDAQREAEEAYQIYLSSQPAEPQERPGGGKGRRKGRNRGYWYREGRGWYISDKGDKPKLCDERGEHIKDPNARELAKAAYARYLVDRESRAEKTGDQTPLIDLCDEYMDWVKRKNSASTFRIRAAALWDLCSGFPPRYRGKTGKQLPASARIHPGYGARPVGSLTMADIDAWLEAHPDWKSHRIPLQALRRMLVHMKRTGRISRNPLPTMKVPQSNKRTTYLPPEIEEAIYKYAKPAIAQAVRACIRTGARPDIEFARLEARHVVETERGQIWKWPKEETKTRRKERVIYVADEIAEIVRKLVKKYPKSPLFRNTKGGPWTGTSLRQAWKRLAGTLKRKNVVMDPETSPYTARHTFAKRMLGGYWGQQVSLEVLAGLMGNTPQICWEHYAQWCPKYTEPLWEAIKGQPQSGQNRSRSAPGEPPAQAAENV